MTRVLIVGPSPPPVGGIAAIVENLNREFKGEDGVYFIDSSKPDLWFKRIFFHPLKLLINIFFKSLLLKGGKVLIFSSANWSFWEKCLWIITSRLAGAHVILIMVDGNFPSFYHSLSRLSKCLASLFIGKIEMLVAQSKSWQIYYQGIFSNITIKTVVAGVDNNFFSPDERNRVLGAPVRIIYVGWLIEAKGIHDLLLAAKQLDIVNLSFELRLVGPPCGNETKLLDSVKTLGLYHKVKIVGLIESREALRDEYLEADIFAFPSHFEGFPVALLEAISSGLPCVGTNVGGIPDILEHGKCGLLVERRSPNALADALRRLIENPKLRSELGVLARERAIKEYSIDKSIESYRDLLGIKKKYHDD